MRVYRVLIVFVPVVIISVAFKIALAMRERDKLTAGQFNAFMNCAFVLALFAFVAAGIYYYYPE